MALGFRRKKEARKTCLWGGRGESRGAPQRELYWVFCLESIYLWVLGEDLNGIFISFSGVLSQVHRLH